MRNSRGAVRSTRFRVPGRIVAAAALLAALILAAGVGAQEPDTTPPTITSISVSSDGSVLTVQFSENFTIPAEDPERNQFLSNIGSRFSVTVDDLTRQVYGLERGHSIDRAALAGEASQSLRLNLKVAITTRQTVTLRYADPTAADDEHVIEDAAGNELASLTSGAGGVPAVTNNSTLDRVLVPFLGGVDLASYDSNWCLTFTDRAQCRDANAQHGVILYVAATYTKVELDLTQVARRVCGSFSTRCRPILQAPVGVTRTVRGALQGNRVLANIDLEGAFGLRLHDGGDDDIFTWFLSGTVHSPDPITALNPRVTSVKTEWVILLLVSSDSDRRINQTNTRMAITITHHPGSEQRAEEGTVVQRFQEWKTGEPVVIRDGARVTGVRSQPGDRAPSGHVFVMVATYSRKPDGTNGEYLGTGYTEAIPTDLVDQVTPAERSGQNQVVTRLSQLPDTEVWCPSNMIGRMPGARNPTAYYRATAHVTASGTVDFSESAMGIAGCTRTRPGG